MVEAATMWVQLKSDWYIMAVAAIATDHGSRVACAPHHDRR
jgi:hypothetical protein